MTMESNSTSSGIQGGPGWAEMENISQDNIQILSEETLRAIAKGPLARFVASCEDDEYASIRLFNATSLTFLVER